MKPRSSSRPAGAVDPSRSSATARSATAAGDLPGPDHARAQVGPEAPAEAVEPFTVRGSAANAGPPVRRAIPGGGSPPPAGVVDRPGGGVDLLSGILGHGRQYLLAQQFARTPPPASPSSELALRRPVREHAGPLPSDFRQEAAFTRSAQHLTHDGHRHHLGSRARRRRRLRSRGYGVPLQPHLPPTVQGGSAYLIFGQAEMTLRFRVPLKLLRGGGRACGKGRRA